ncbi:MAG: hypothetical protein NTZ01_03315, partial [Verrucomicrobia bacterium]|nr:hypothetical protein [Verrucomicrobiota bacterium]
MSIAILNKSPDMSSSLTELLFSVPCKHRRIVISLASELGVRKNEGVDRVRLGLPLLCYYSFPVAERISFAWLWIPGFLVATTLPLFLSRFWHHQKSVDQLTLWTLKE